MNKNELRVLVAALFLCSLFACSKQAQYISTVTPGENPYIVQIDSFNGNFVVFRADSFLTSTDSFALVGYYKDTTFGVTNCEHYARFEFPGVTEIPNTAQYDSIELILQSYHNSYGDSIVPMQFGVERLSSSIANETNQFYNTTTIPAFNNLLGTKTVRYRPQADDSLSIALDNNFGLELFGKFKSKSDVVSSNDKFQEYFRGLKVFTDHNTSSQIASFKRNFIIRLHYHEDVGNIIPKQIDINSSGSGFQFNAITKNYSGSTLAAFQTAKEINAASLGNRFFLQELLRIRTRINFPGIKEVLQASDYVKILNAQLEVKPVSGSWVQHPIPEAINVYTQLIDQSLSTVLVNSTGQTQDGSLTLDNLYGTATNYLFDVTDYLNTELTATNFTTKNLVLIPVGSQGELSRLVGNTTNATSLRSRLIISLLVYKNQ